METLSSPPPRTPSPPSISSFWKPVNCWARLTNAVNAARWSRTSLAVLTALSYARTATMHNNNNERRVENHGTLHWRKHSLCSLGPVDLVQRRARLQEGLQIRSPRGRRKLRTQAPGRL